MRNALDSRKQGLFEPVVNYIVAKQSICMGANSTMGEAEVLFHISKGLLGPIRAAITISSPLTIADFTTQAKKVELSDRLEQEGDGIPDGASSPHETSTATVLAAFEGQAKEQKDDYMKQLSKYLKTELKIGDGNGDQKKRAPISRQQQPR